MSLLTNHRISSYKKARKSPTVVKVPIRRQTRNKGTTFQKLLAAIQYGREIVRAAPTPHPTPVLAAAPPPTAPPAELISQTICVWDMMYRVEIPVGFDIYEGLRKWYPSLYAAVMEEERLIRGEPSTPKMTEEEVEAAWAQYEYLEYLSDY
jgi:hypothetical protein